MSLLMEQAKKLHDAGISVQHIGERLGKTEQWVIAALAIDPSVEPSEPVKKPVEAFVSSPEFVLMKRTKEMADKGMTKVSISKEIGRKESWVIGTLAIMSKLPKSIHDAMEKSKISRSIALQLLFAPIDKLDVICEGTLQLCEVEKL